MAMGSAGAVQQMVRVPARTEYNSGMPHTSNKHAVPWRRRAGLVVIFLWFAIGGVAHFVATDAEMRIVPPWMPWPRAAVLASGVFELLGAAGFLWAPTRRAAGIGLFLLTIAVTPAHFYMLQVPEQFGVPYWLLVARLPLQAALLALIAWATFGVRAEASA